MSELEGMPIANIVLGEIIDEVTQKTYIFDTADKADVKPDLSAGKEDILRVKNRIIAMNRTEDICIGYDIKLTNNTFPTELMAIVDGGIITADGYEGPEVGIVTERHPFTLNLYSEEKDYDSATLQYVQFAFKHNKGKPVEFKFEDGKFFVPEFESHSRPKKGEKPVYIKFLKQLPKGDAVPVTQPNTGDMKVDGGTVTGSNTDVGVSIGSNVKWTFVKAINQDDVTATNFVVKKKSDSTVVTGNVTIDSTKKIVTFIPTSIEAGVIYVAEAKAINLLDASGTTTAILVEFTTI
ncbi:Ig-like domain-containing protein [Clostridium estertheticum]|uniref:Ig-like domain-containing protein n=1 Tax=Clostridium estertheticum TaxID=238834 RepID=UPI001C0CC5A0|nr:Ig-like domain-containing protein [Clostridium estertheticum]MBU3185658.1 Ig-like domain-containing protein [Clostridium estertheticum]